MADITAGQQLEEAPSGRLFQNWRYVLATTNPPRGRLDPVSKWLYLTRAGVLPMTLVAAAVAGLLAIYRGDDVSWGWFALAAVGLVGAARLRVGDVGVRRHREPWVDSPAMCRRGVPGDRPPAPVSPRWI